jgi:hypothetical protein
VDEYDHAIAAEMQCRRPCSTAVMIPRAVKNTKGIGSREGNREEWSGDWGMGKGTNNK